MLTFLLQPHKKPMLDFGSSQGLNHQPKSTHGGVEGPMTLAAYVAEDGIVWHQ
jgi:hypothetical protein